MVPVMACQEDDFLAFDLAHGECIRWLAIWSINFNFKDILEQFSIVETGSSKDTNFSREKISDSGFFGEFHGFDESFSDI